MNFEFNYPDHANQRPSRLKFLRAVRRLSLDEICEIVGCDRKAYLDFENSIDFPDDDTVVFKLCEFYQEPYESLIQTATPAEYYYLLYPTPIYREDDDDDFEEVNEFVDEEVQATAA
jgi:transcriptional regulator with XRE-family HTH domain